jgi:glycosyltransferase involved in cell wall biosynthesis
MRVSLCTVCKNRAHHYKKTILKNIHDNIHDSNVEFILLDYNSQDDLEEWVRDNLQDYIEMGVVTYYKTFDPLYFQRSHSRNMVFRLAKGDLICNIDADNYTGYSFST